MKIIKIFIFCILQFSVSNAQQLEVINSGGGFYENDQGSLTFSIGEVVIETISQDKLYYLTQGFCQADIMVIPMPPPSYDILLYPNPAKDFVILKINNDDLGNLSYLLYDINGVLLRSNQITSNESSIPFSSLAPATYLLKIINNQIEVKSFKIIKIK
ncbi:MAG: T9SS type A sorting domain-containing protein [Bacteroidetes bacterium]|nr:T9SS type A sorting domain-containing protein [Bacteroidota bacterium]